MTGPVIHCAFRYLCPAQWAELSSTSDPAVRFCDVCRHDVHFCSSEKDLKRHVAARHCVVIEPNESGDDAAALIGMPDPNDYRLARTTNEGRDK